MVLLAMTPPLVVERSMSEKTVRIKVSPRVAELLSGQAPPAALREAVGGRGDVVGWERLTILFYVAHGRDGDLRQAALEALQNWPMAELGQLAGDASLHPAILDFIARRRGVEPALRAVLLSNPALSDSGRQPLLEHDEASGGTGPDGATDEHESKYQQSLHMGVAEKIKVALTGDKEWRALLINDTNKLVSSAVLKNPRITEGEVLALARNRSTGDELIRLIMLNREWMKSYAIKQALVCHPRTPVGQALRFMSILSEKDLKSLAKSREVSPVLVNQARRMLLGKQRQG